MSDLLLDWAWTIICNAGEGDWTRESADWQEAAANFREQYHAHLDTRPRRYWHAYQAEIPDSLDGSLAFTIIGDTPQGEVPQTNLGVVLNHELVYRHVHTWDHEPTEAEKEQVQLDFQLAKEKEEK